MVIAGLLGAQAPLPATGVDLTGIDEFYRIADILSKDADPTPAQWGALFFTPSYRLASHMTVPMREHLSLALKPSRKAGRDSVFSRTDGPWYPVQHYMHAYERRDDILRMRRALERSVGDSIARSVRNAAPYLPRNVVGSRQPPFIGFAFFGYDGYSLDGGVLIDPVYAVNEGLTDLLSHEFHHAYAGSVDKTVRWAGGSPPDDAVLVRALIQLRSEGIADLVDKPYPLPPRQGHLAWYPPQYNDAYARTPQILQSIDSLLIGVRDHPATAIAAGREAQRLLWSGSHPNGAYMARTIVSAFGADSLHAGVYNPFAFIRTYASAQISRGNPPPFSTKALEVLANMERRYVRP
jgi:hypothetical protein